MSPDKSKRDLRAAVIMKKKEIIAKVLRTLTVPPAMALLLTSVLAGSRPDIFSIWPEAVTLTLLLAFVPALAYPWQKWTARDGRANREAQRDMAFTFTVIGYSTALFWVTVSRRNRYIFMICLTYFLSAAVLTVCNQLLHIRASGHACGTTAPLLLLVLLTGWKMFPLGLLLAGAAVWSSLYLKRHTIRELALGCGVCAVSLVLSACIMMYLRGNAS